MLIQKLRLQRGWSQEQLSDLSGLSVRTIQRIERGQTPSVESLKAIAAVFEVDFSTLREPEMETAFDPRLRADEALALAHVRKLRAFYVHLTQYALIVSLLAVVNLTTFPRHLWFGWVALAWGVGVAFHGLQVFNKLPFLGADWERAQVEKQLGRKL